MTKDEAVKMLEGTVQYFFIEAHLPKDGWTVTGTTLHKVEMPEAERAERWEEFRKTSGCYDIMAFSSWRGDFATIDVARKYGELWEFPPFTLCPKCFVADVGEEA